MVTGQVAQILGIFLKSVPAVSNLSPPSDITPFSSGLVSRNKPQTASTVTKKKPMPPSPVIKQQFLRNKSSTFPPLTKPSPKSLASKSKPSINNNNLKLKVEVSSECVRMRPNKHLPKSLQGFLNPQ